MSVLTICCYGLADARGEKIGISRGDMLVWSHDDRTITIRSPHEGKTPYFRRYTTGELDNKIHVGGMTAPDVERCFLSPLAWKYELRWRKIEGQSKNSNEYFEFY